MRTQKADLTALSTGLAALAAILSGCDLGGSPLSSLSGHYEGTLTTLDQPATAEHAAVYSQTGVQTDIGAADKGGKRDPYAVSATDASGAPKITLDVKPSSGGKLTLTSSVTLKGSVELTPEKNTKCYVGTNAPGGGLAVTFCVSHPELSLDVRDTAAKLEVLSLVLHPFRTNDTFDTSGEKPQPFTLDQAIDRAKTKSFQSRIEFEHVIQAKAHAKAAYLHLLPQLTLGTVVSNVVGATWQSLVSAIGDLAPFLLPTRWFQAAAASNQKKAEDDAYTLMRLTMAAQAEGMFYAYARDAKSLDYTQAMLVQAIQIRNEVKIRENAGQLIEGSTANMNSIINQIQQNVTVLRQINVEDLASISQTLGYYEPTTVADAIVGPELVPIEQAKKLDYETVKAETLKKAIELDQMDYLIKAAEQTKTASFFSFIDPYADPSLGLGFALPSQVAVLSSQVRELVIDKQQLQSIIEGRVLDDLTDMNQAIDSFKLATEGMTIQHTRLNTELIQLQTGYNIDFFGLLGIMQDFLNAQIQLETSRANYRVARSEIDRLLLQGYYGHF